MGINVGFIGAGNVAWHLAPALDNIGAKVTYVYNRTPDAGKALVKRLYEAQYTDHLDLSNKGLDLVIIAVSDDHIEKIASELIVGRNTIVVHSSGAQSIDILDYYFEKYGILYPLQTFSKSKKVNFKDIPVLIEGSDTQTTELLHKLVTRLTDSVQEVSSRDRLYVHLAAVFACNFSNHMLTIAESILKQHKLSLNILHPLISETINKSLELGPKAAQTGPAKRHDLKTLDKHMAQLSKDEELSELYKIISQHIINSFQ